VARGLMADGPALHLLASVGGAFAATLASIGPA
jgi:hypothetical protein